MNTFQKRSHALTGSACLKKELERNKPVRKRVAVPAINAGKGLVLRTCEPVKNGIYPKKIRGLKGQASEIFYGWMFGEGQYKHDESTLLGEACWQVIEVQLADILKQEGSVSFSHGIIRHSGDKLSATQYLLEHEPRSRNATVIGACLHVGNRRRVRVGALGIATAGDKGTAFAGDFGEAIAGNYGLAIAGNRGTSSVGDRGHARAGDHGKATAGKRGKAFAGNCGEALALTYGIASAGIRGSAIAGDFGFAIVDYMGTACAGVNGTVCAGDGGEIRLKYEICAGQSKTVIGYIGEKGLRPRTAYKLDTNHEFAPTSQILGAFE